MSDADLVQLIRAGGLPGAEALYDTYSRLICLVVIRIIPHQALAEQVIQATFLQIFNSIDDYDIGKEKIYTWIVTIAKTLAFEAKTNRISESTNKDISAGQR